MGMMVSRDDRPYRGPHSDGLARLGEARVHRHPDLFLSHSSRDKAFVRQLSENLTFCEVDVWLDEWELQVGGSLHDLIGNALERSRFIGVILGDNFSDSQWARDELKQALAKERRVGRASVLPLICGNCQIPSFLEDRIYVDFRSDYYVALARLAGAVHGVSRLRIEEAVRVAHPYALCDVINALRYGGVEPYIVLGEDDFKEICAIPGSILVGDRVRFNPERVRRSEVSPRLRNLMKKLIDEVWVTGSQRSPARWRESPGESPF